MGWLSATGVVPACRSLDTISIFALTARDAERVTHVAAAFDASEAYSRPLEGHGFDFGTSRNFRVGIPRAAQLQFFGNADTTRLFKQAVERVAALGGECVEVDLQPFLDTARLLYEGPWVAERYAAIRDFFDAKPEALLPVIREIIGGAKRWSAADAYAYGYQLKAARRTCAALWGEVDCVLTPSAGTIYTIAEMEADPIRLNANLGYYTNFMNLLDYAATAIPAGFQAGGLPFGITVFAPAHQDGPLLHLAAKLQAATMTCLGTSGTLLPAGAIETGLPSGQIRVAVCGAHLSGLPLNGQLTSRGGRLVSATGSSSNYRL